MIRGFVILFLSTAFVAQPSGQRGTLDPAFEKIPFDQWLGEHDQASFRWTASVPRAILSFHQRLVARAEVKLDGRDLETRRAGSLVFFIQITDRDGTRYQDHGTVELSKLDENIKAANLDYAQRAFILPGDYRLAAAILFTATGEHSTRQTQFRVAKPQHDLLPGAWRDLLPVEFIGNEESPDSWYLPDIQGRLAWAASVHVPARVNVILNVTPSVPLPGSRRTQSGDLAALLPTLKVVSQTGSPSVSERVELLDLARRRAVFDQRDLHEGIDWPRLKTALGQADTASIDVHSLAERHHDAQFFVSQVRSLLRSSDEPCVLVVLTKPVAFDSGEDLAPVSLESLPACRVFYIRYRTSVQSVSPFGRQMGGRGRGGRMGGPMGNRLPQDIVDQLEATLKPLSPKVFDVETPEQMTRALADIEKALLTAEGQSAH